MIFECKSPRTDDGPHPCPLAVEQITNDFLDAAARSYVVHPWHPVQRKPIVNAMRYGDDADTAHRAYMQVGAIDMHISSMPPPIPWAPIKPEVRS